MSELSAFLSLNLAVREAKKDRDCDALGGGGEGGDDLVEVLHGGSFTREVEFNDSQV